MKKYVILILALILNTQFSQAQKINFPDLWKKVQDLESQGLTKSALETVVEIKSKAHKEKNINQKIKALMYTSKYALVLEEDAQLKIIKDFKEEIAKSKSPEKNILESILANLYWQYFQQNRWRFYNRTKTTEKVDQSDFRTWDLQTIFSEIDHHFKNSLQNGLILKSEKLSSYDALLKTAEDSKIFRPTLYDFIAHQALTFYKTDENNITKPAYKFEIDNPEYLSDFKQFSDLIVTSKDTASLQLKALKIYQDLIKLHLKDKEPFALVDVDIQRLKYVNQNATLPDKENQLIQALSDSKNNFNNHEVSGLYDFEIASVYNTQANTYKPKENEEERWKRKQALEICEQVIANFPSSTGAQKCEVLKKQILQKQLNITNEGFIPINKPSKLLVNYRNLDELNLFAYKVTKNQLERIEKIRKYEDKLKYIRELNLLHEWKSTLKNEKDYQSHTTEVLVPAMNNGLFIVLALPDSKSDNIFAFSTIQVTNLAFIEKNGNTSSAFQLINRNNGEPIKNTSIKLTFQRKYNGPVLNEVYKTDKNGIIKINNSKRYINVNAYVSYKDDEAHFGPFYINKRYDYSQDDINQAYLFTDRSIYRPGQTVYFKGIAVKKHIAKSEVIQNENISVTLRDVNWQELKVIQLKTNEYGSFHGEFILPANGLTGNFTIDAISRDSDLSGRANFSVEEYKRPKFETKFEAVTETYKVNDDIKVKGTAVAYAGSNITNAKVVYRVHRQVQYPRWYYWYRPYFSSEPQEIIHGETTTNEKGEYEITFKALPDQSIDKKNLPVFNYEVTADVTDINGETRSSTTVVRVGYHSLLATVTASNKLDKDSKENKLLLSTQNLNGKFVPAQGSIKIYKLKAPDKVFRKRPWNAPDYQEINEEEFRKLFPNEAYNDENNFNNWEKGELVCEHDFDTEKETEINLGNIKKWISGKYIIELESKDKFGQEVKDVQHTEVYSNDDKTASDNQLFFIATDKNSYAINDQVVLKLSSAAQNLFVTVDVEKDKKIISSEVYNLNNNSKEIKIPVSNTDLGGFIIHYSFSAFNSFENGAISINVPYPSSDLEIETITFRDKLQPGQDETWSFKIKGPKGDKVAAEMLASMYDASLDQFLPHGWYFAPINKPIYYAHYRHNANNSFRILNFRYYVTEREYYSYPSQYYDQLNWFGLYFGNVQRNLYRSKRLEVQAADAPMPAMEMKGAVEEVEADMEEVAFSGAPPANKESNESSPSSDPAEKSKAPESDFEGVQIRKNLQETAFFLPQLRTDNEGTISFSFTAPEALTQWKLQLLAHTKTLESAVESLTTVTQKELMVTPNAPRFLREGDQITINSKISNLTEKKLAGQAILHLYDAVSGKEISKKLLKSSINSSPTGEDAEGRRGFTVDSKGNTNVSWTIQIPDDVQSVQYKVIAKANDFSDGEQNVLPVLSNRMLVTETMPMWIGSNQTKTFTLEKLKNNRSNTLKHHQLTLEMTSNPAWYAVQALPYLMEYPYECNEQIFARYYANKLASHIANSNPRIKDVFDQWRNTDALLSNLEKNQELKSLLIQETPWLRDAQSETEQKKRIGLLFDLNKMSNELQNSKRKLMQSQMGNGAWSWFDGGYPSRFITQHIITGFGHLKHLKVENDNTVFEMIQKAIPFLDNEFVEEYERMKAYATNLDDDHLTYSQIHYLYMRSFFKEIPMQNNVKEITNYYKGQAQKYWLSKSLYAKGLLALILHRMDDTTTANKILRSLKENSITNEELGMYWKENTASWFWYQAPIETQSLLIEAFSEIENDTKTIDNLKIWLLKNKQTNQWKTTKATTEAVYALLLQGSDWLSITDQVDIKIANKKIEPSKLENVKVEAGTGYFKTSWSGKEIKRDMANVTISKKGKGIAWGGLYWQYFENLDKITHAETPLKLSKKLFLKKYSDTGEKITAIDNETTLQVGDLIRVRIELRSDRDMEFVHMKDMRAASLEPVNVLSQYKWQDGLGYYESTKDASTNFFFDYLPKGVYVFEYDLRVNNSGNFSNGITTIQSMYAPEFTSHSEGVRVKIQK